jgi:transposase
LLGYSGHFLLVCVGAVDAAGQAIVGKALRRAQVLPFFAKLPPCLVGMEACGTSHHRARQAPSATLTVSERGISRGANA